MSEEREMTLAEWVGRLPQPHLAHREYTKLKARIEALEKAAREVVDTMRGSGGIDPKAADALMRLAVLSEGGK